MVQLGLNHLAPKRSLRAKLFQTSFLALTVPPLYRIVNDLISNDLDVLRNYPKIRLKDDSSKDDCLTFIIFIETVV